MRTIARSVPAESPPDIVSVVPAASGWGVAVLWDGSPELIDFTIHAIAAWAVVRRTPKGGKRALTVVVPMTAEGVELQLEIKDEDEEFDLLIVEPGLRPVVRRHDETGQHYLATEPGTWIPGQQALDGGQS